jgi:hypothetical protein
MAGKFLRLPFLDCDPQINFRVAGSCRVVVRIYGLLPFNCSSCFLAHSSWGFSLRIFW